jgi:hypothetical protein
MRNRFIYGDSATYHGFADLFGADFGYWDFSWNWLENDDAVGNTTLDRLYVDWTPDEWQARFGRHRVNWGMTMLWNPNDLFNSYSIYDFDYEERAGTDSLLLGRNLGFASEAELVWALGDTWDDTSLAGRYLFNTNGYDIQLLGGKNRLDVVAGGGFAGAIQGAGFRGELSYFDPYKDDPDLLPQHQREPSTIATLESDYSFKGPRNFILKGDIIFVSHPEDPGNALIYLNQPLTARTLSFTEWAGYVDGTFDVTSLSKQTLGFNMYDDGSYFGMASNSISMADDWELLLVWQYFSGDTNSLFGGNPSHLLFGRIRWSF